MKNKEKANVRGIGIILGILIIVVAIAIAKAATSNAKNKPEQWAETTTTLTETTTTVDFEQNYELFVNFINDSNSKELAANVISETNEVKAYVMRKATNQLKDAEVVEVQKVESIKCWIHSYRAGDYVGMIAVNDDSKCYYNYTHNGDLLAASLLSEKYPDNLSLADARISALVLTKISTEQIEKFCIQKDSEGKEFYNLSVRDNAKFADLAKVILA